MTDPHPPASAPGPAPTVMAPTPSGAAPTSYGLDTPAPARVELVDQVAAAVLAVPGVAGLHGGTFGEAATYLPGRRVSGIRLREDGTDIHLTLTFGSPVRVTAENVRAALTGLVATPIDVTVEDLVTADDLAPAEDLVLPTTLPRPGPERSR